MLYQENSGIIVRKYMSSGGRQRRIGTHDAD